MNIDLKFLQAIEAIPNPEDEKGSKPRTKRVLTPLGLALRIFSNGEVYPSENLVSEWELEYAQQDSESGYGIDVIDSRRWANYPYNKYTLEQKGFDVKDYPQLIFLARVKRSENSNIDLFGITRYDEKGEPKASVLNQGSAKEYLVELIKEIYPDYAIQFEEQGFVDLQITGDTLQTADNFYIVPKTVSKGERKGENTYSKRVGIVPFVAIPKDIIDKEEPKDEETVESTQTVAN